MQSNIDCWLPRYHIYRNMKDFQSDLKNIYSQEDNQILKILAHPSKLKEAEDSNYRHRKRFLEMRVGEKEDHDLPTTSTIDPVPSQSITHLIPTISSMESPKRIVIGIGPDGGWTDDELHFFHINQFHFVNLGNRILRTDMAVSVDRWSFWSYFFL